MSNIESTVRREECADEGVEETIIVDEEFDFHGEHVERETRLHIGEDGHVTVDQRLQGLFDSVTLSGDVLDLLEGRR